MIGLTPGTKVLSLSVARKAAHAILPLRRSARDP
jgi:hypothetical protein